MAQAGTRRRPGTAKRTSSRSSSGGGSSKARSSRPVRLRAKSPVAGGSAARGSSTSSSQAASGSEGRYTKPDLRQKLKEEIQAGDKGGRKGQWSARKAQLLAHEYEKRGGGYRGGKGDAQKHLEKWTSEEWQTKDGDARARHGRETDRYLPKKAWAELSPAEKRKTDAAKRAGSRKGEQFVANTPKAKAAGRAARKKS